MEDSKATEGHADDAAVIDADSGSVTDEALTAALEGREPETSEPEPTVKATEAELRAQEDDHQEKSHLGRKVKKLEEVMVTKVEFNQLMNKLDSFITKPVEQNTAQSDIPEYVATPEDVEKVIQARERRISAEQESYQKAYVSQMVSMGTGNDEHDDVVKEMMANFNVRRTGNPQIDAELNYANAKAAVMSRGTQRTVPVKGDKPVAAGVTHGNTNTQHKVMLPKLSPDAENFVAYMRRQGMTDESIAEALR